MARKNLFIPPANKQPKNRKSNPMNSLKRIISFGFRHGGGPNVIEGVAVIDIRPKFRNPYHDKKLRKLRGTDELVQEDIKQTPDFDSKYRELQTKIEKLVEKSGVHTVYIGCTGGHHRSVYLATLLGEHFQVLVIHRDYDKP
jgi:UPF0042 nucleotide-binding protein